MKTLLKITLFAAPVAGLVLVGRAYHRESVQHGNLQDQAAVYYREALTLGTRSRALQARVEELEQLVAMQSNLLVRTQANLLEEKSTLTPLREKIEEMNAAQVTFHAQMRLKDEQLSQAQADLRAAREQSQAAEQKVAALEPKVGNLESVVKNLSAERDDLKQKVNQAMEKTSKLESELVAERASVKDLGAKLSAADQRAGDLAKQSTSAKSELDKAVQQSRAELAAARARIAELEAKLKQAGVAQP